MKSNTLFYPTAALFIGLGSGIFEINIIRLSKIIFRFDTAFIWFAAAIFFIICGHAWTIIRKPGPNFLIHTASIIGFIGLVCHISPWPWYFLFPLFPFFFIGQAHTVIYSKPHINHLVYIFETLGFTLGMSILGPFITSLPLFKIPGAVTISGLFFLLAYFILQRDPKNKRANFKKTLRPNSGFILITASIVFMPLLINIFSSDGLSKNAALMKSPISTHLREEISEKRLKSHICYESLSARTDEIINSQNQTHFYTDGMFCAKAVRIKTIFNAKDEKKLIHAINPTNGSNYTLLNPETEKLAFLKRLPFKLIRQNPESSDKKRPEQKLKTILNLGAGAGFDTLIALQENAENITAVEINSTITSRAMRMPHTSGICYLDKRVNLINDEARSWLAKNSAKNKFDLITLALMESSDSAGPSAMFIHAPLFTEQAFKLYWNSLTSNGLIAVIHNQKAPINSNISTLLRMFSSNGLKNPASHFIIITPDKPFINSFDHLLLVFKMPFSEKQIIKIKTILKDRSLTKEIFHLENSSRILTTMHGKNQEAPTDNRPFLFSKIYGFQNMFGLFILIFLMLFSCFLFYLKKTMPLKILKTSLTLFTASAGIIIIQTALLYFGQSLLGYPSKATALVGGVAVFGSVTGVLLCRKKTGLFIFTVPLIWLCLFWIYRPFDFNFFKQLPGFLSESQIALSTITYICFLFTGLIFVRAMTSDELKIGDDTSRNKLTAVYLFSDGLGYITGAAAALLISFIWGYSSLITAGIMLFGMATVIYVTCHE